VSKKPCNIVLSFSASFFALNKSRGFSHSTQLTVMPTFFARAAEGQKGIVCFALVIFILPFVFAFLSEGL
jgi:hypothetical protein